MRTQTSQKAELFERTLRMVFLGVFAVSVAFLAIGLFVPAKTGAAVSNTVNFQAKLQTNGGAIVPDGNYNVEFKLYDTSTVTGTPDQGACTYNGGTADTHCLWVETRVSGDQVRVANGYLTVNLGSVTAFGTINWNQQLWLTMRIGGTGSPSWDGEMSPRIQLTASPYAFQAGELGNGTNRATFDSSGNLQFQQASTIKELSAASGTQLTIQGGAATTGTNVGGNVLIQGGAGASTGASGSVIVKSNTNNSTTAFQVQNASSNEVLTIDTTNGYAILGKGSTINGTLVFQNSTNANAVIIQSGVTTGSGYTLTLPTALPGSTQCLQSTSGGVLSFGTCGGGGTLASDYTNGASQTDSTLALDSTRLGIIIKDNATPITGSLLTVQDNGGSTKFLDVRSNGFDLLGGGNSTLTTSSGNLTVDAGAGTVNIGTSTNNKTVNIGAIGPTANTTTIHVGDSSAAAQTITIGSTNGSSTTTIQGGTGNIVLQTNANTAGVLVKANTDSTTAFQIQNAAGNDNLFLANTTNSNLLTNSSFETNTTNWAVNAGSGSVASTTSQALYGNAALSITTAGSTSHAGAKYDTSTLLSATTTYALSFWAKIAAGSFTVEAGRSDTDAAGGETTCSLSSTSVSTTWARFTCSFTTSGSITTGGYIFIRQSDSSNRTWFVDGVQLEQAASPTPYHEGTIQLNGLVTSPVVFQNAQDTVQAWQVKNAAGTANVITVDTANIRLGVNTLSPTVALDVVGKGNFSTAAQTPLLDSISGALTIGTTNASSIGLGSTSSNIVTTINGTAVVKPTSGNDSATAFQIQKANASVLFNADTTNMRLGVNATYAAMSAPSSLAKTNGSGTLTAGNTFRYEVTAIDSAGGETGVSNELSGVTGATGYNLTWTAVTGASGYKVYRTANGGGSGTEKYMITVKTASYTDDGTYAPNTNYATPSTNTAYVSTNVASNELQLSVGGLAKPAGQLYVSGTVPATFAGSIGTEGNAQTVTVRGKYAYVGELFGSQQFAVYDINSPTSPRFLGKVASGMGDTYTLGVQGRYAYVGSTNGLQIVDITNPSSPTLLSTLSTAGYDDVQGDYVYSTDGTNFMIVDITNPLNPRIISTTSVGANNADGVTVSGKYAYVWGHFNSLLTIYDITNPVSPSSVGTYNPDFWPNDIKVQGRYLYIAVQAGLEIVDISNPASPVQANLLDLSTYFPTDPAKAVEVQGRYAYVVGQGSSRGSLVMIDVSNPYVPVALGSVNDSTSSVATDVAVQGRYAYVTNDSNGALDVYDLGGAYIQQLEVGGTETGDLQVDQNAAISGDADIQGGLSVGQSVMFNNALTTQGPATFINKTNTTTAFQIQNAAGSNLVNVDTSTTSNVITNGDFESQSTTNWSAKGASTTLSQVTTKQWQGNGSMQVFVNNAVANRGAQYSYTFSAVPYTLSAYVMGNGAYTDIAIGYHDSTDHNCATAATLSTTAWTRVTCTFTPSAGAGQIYVIRTGTSVETFFADGIQLQTGSTASGFNAGGSIHLSGVVNSPITFQNRADSSTAFLVQNAAGNSYLNVNTLGATVSLGDAGIASTVQIGNTTGAVTQTINIGNNATASSTSNIVIGSTIAGTTTLQSAGGTVLSTLGTTNSVTYLCRNGSNILAACQTNATGSAFVQGGNSFGAQAVLGTSDGNSLAFRTNSGTRIVIDTSGNQQFQQASTVNIASATTGTQLTIQGGAATSGTNVGGNLLLQGGAGASTGASGSVIVQSNTNNSTTAFQIKNAAGTSTPLTVDTVNNRVGIGTSSPADLLHIASGSGSTQIILGTNISGGAGIIQLRGNASQYNWIVAANDNVADMEFTPSTAVAGTTFSTPVFRIQQAGSIQIGNPSNVTGSAIFNTSSSSSTVTLSVGSTSSSYSILLPTAGGSANQCLQLGGGGGSQLQWGACGGGATGLAKNAADSSSASVSGGSFLYSFTNSNTSTSGGVVKLDNGTNTGDALQVLGNEMVKAQNDQKTLGAELYSSNFSTWTSTNWTLGGGNTTATHNTGNTSALVDQNVAVTSGTTYRVSFVIGGSCSTTSDTVTASIGGTTLGAAITGTNCAGNTYTYLAVAGSTTKLTFTPTSSWNGTVSAISIKALSGSISQAFTLQNASGSSSLEIRASADTTNMFIGRSTGSNVVSGGCNSVGVGNLSLQNLTTGCSNAAVGYQAMQNTTTSGNDAALGAFALQANSTGADDTAIGFAAMQANTTGGQNTSIGSQSLYTNTTGFGDNALGVQALYLNTNGNGNTAIGNSALYTNTSSSDSTAVGYSSLQVSTGQHNTALGSQSGGAVTSGQGNTFLGFDAGKQDSNGNFVTVATVQNSTAIGQFAQVQSSNTIALGMVDTTTKVVIGSTIADNLLSVSPLFYGSSTNGSQSTNTLTDASVNFTTLNVKIGMRVIYADGTDGGTVTAVGTTTLTLSTSQTVAAQKYRIHIVGLQVTTAGATLVQTTSTTAFQVQNSAAASYLTVDTSSTVGKLQVGSSSTDGSAILLVLDSYNTTDPTGTNGGMYYSTSTNTFRCYENSIWKNCIDTPSNASTADQSVGASTTAYLTGSAITIPSSGLHAGSQFIWKITVAKSAAGTAALVYDVRFGTNGTTADTSRLSFTTATETGVADTATIQILVTVRSVSSTGVIAGNYQLTHNLNTTGFSNAGSTSVNVTSGTFDNTVANSIIGVSVTTGASYSLTYQQVSVTTVNL